MTAERTLVLDHERVQIGDIQPHNIQAEFLISGIKPYLVLDHIRCTIQELNRYLTICGQNW